MNSNMETKEFNVYNQRDRGVPLLKFASMDPIQISQLGTILNFCREHQLPPPERYAMYGSVNDMVMNVPVPNIMYSQINRPNSTMEVYALLCREFGADNVNKLVLRDPEIVRQRTLTILSHATDNVFKTDELDVAVRVEMNSRRPITYVDEAILECLQHNYIQERVRRIDTFDGSPMGSYNVYHIKKVGKET